MRLPLLQLFAKREGNSFTSPPNSPDPTLLFQNWKTSSLDGDISPDRRLDLPFNSTLLVYLHQRTVSHSGSGIID